LTRCDRVFALVESGEMGDIPIIGYNSTIPAPIIE
jgi:hypothetical protein